MPNIAYFEIPADNVDRAKHFYKNLLGWKIEPIRTPTLDLKSTEAMGYQEMTLGDPTLGTINMGGLYRRVKGETIRNYVQVDDIDTVLTNVEKLGGKILIPKFMMKGVGLPSVIRDTEGNDIGIWEQKM
jgi:hypothetical protein